MARTAQIEVRVITFPMRLQIRVLTVLAWLICNWFPFRRRVLFRLTPRLSQVKSLRSGVLVMVAWISLARDEDAEDLIEF